MSNCIEWKDVTVRYGKKQALKNISLQVHENQLIGLLGKNGSGKTTFMRACAGFLSIEGFGRILEGNPQKDIAVANEIVYCGSGILQLKQHRLNKILDIYEIMYERFDRSFVVKGMELFSLNARQKYGSLSTGMASIFSFLCGLGTRAKLTFLDEPMNGMDITVRKKVYEILLRDYMKYPRTILVSSHILEELENIFSEVILIDQGAVILYEEVEKIHDTMYRIIGTREQIQQQLKDKKVIYKSYGGITEYAIIKEKCTEEIQQKLQNAGLKVEGVTLEEVYLAMTQEEKREGDVECLWED